MTQMEITAHETGRLRVFAIDLPRDRIAGFVAEGTSGDWPLRDALGADHLRDSYVETVAIDDLGGMPLSTYLAEGYGLSGDDFRGARPQLDALTGHVLLLPSSAFGQSAQQLDVARPLRWIGTFSEETRPADLTPLRSDAARGSLSGDGAGAPASKGSSRTLKILLAALAVIVLLVLLLSFGTGS